MKHIELIDIVSNKITPLKATNTIQDGLNLMSAHSISSVVITNDLNIPIGIFTEKDTLNIISENIKKSTLIEEVMSKNVFCLKSSVDLHDAYVILEQKGYRHLVVIDEEGLYLGVISEGDFLRNLGFEDIVQSKLVKDVMHEAPLIIKQKTSIITVAKMMNEKKSTFVIIVDETKPLGILSEREIANFLANKNIGFEEKVDTLPYLDAIFVRQNIPLKEASKIMRKHGVHQLIVVNDNEHMIGILDRHDVLKATHGAYFNYLIDLIDKKNDTLLALQESKQLLSTKTAMLNNVINTIPDLIWLKDLDGKYMECNHMFERFFGAKESDIIGKTDFDFVDKELAEFFRINDKKALFAGEASHNEEYLVFADGSFEGIFDTVKTPMKDEQNNFIGVLGIAHNITERKEYEDSLKQKDAILNEAQELSHVGNWQLDIKNNLFTGSDEAYRIFGLEANEENISSEFLRTFIHPDDLDKFMLNHIKAIATGQYNLIYRIIVNNNLKWIHAYASSSKDENGNYTELKGILKDITEQKLHEEQLEILANFDPLTGLANRTLLQTHLHQSIKSAKESNKAIALLLFDLDDFKNINDSFGHHIGDEILKMAAARLMQHVNKTDFLARTGGDEFAVILTNITKQKNVTKFAQDMIELLSQSYLLSNQLEIHIGASVGIVIESEHITTAQELLQYVDSALFKAKKEGRSTYAYYTSELTRFAIERMKNEHRLRRAIDNHEFELYYQPQVHFQSGHIVGVEALIRWNDPEFGLISPDDFISIAEETGLISPIGKWVLEEACRQGKYWLDCGYNLSMSVNVSPYQIKNQNIIELVDDALKKSAFNPNKLVIELTESAMMQREEEIVTMLHMLRSKGVRLAIDDFGTGYSSYSYLKRFPIDILKIDKSFIDDVPYEKDDIAIVEAIIAMGKALGFSILAEGTEKIEQIEFLKNQGCTYYQGYYKSKPLPAKQFEEQFLLL